MKSKNKVNTYGDREHNCPVCNEPLPAHQTWPGAQFRFCGKPECYVAFKLTKKVKYLGPNEHKCEAEGCDNFVPEGLYWFRPTYLTCSPSCWLLRYSADHPRPPCLCGCGQIIPVRPHTGDLRISGYFSKSHYNAHQTKANLQESCGQFCAIVEEYFNGFAALHYRDANELRAKLFVFFRFLNEKEIASLDDVTPQTITAYLKWGRDSGRLVAAYSVGALSTFFKWQISEGRRKAANPVIGLIHNAPAKHRLPRPLEADELGLMWKLLGERGNARTRFAAAAGEESGLRIGEICNLRLSDVDVRRQRFFIRLPNKTNRERWAFFADKTKRFYIEWMAERDQNCGHDFVLHNTLGDPSCPSTLSDEFKRTLCKTYEGTAIHETGFDKWSTHRLRHTMATNLASAGADAAMVMAAGGWSSPEAMGAYVRLDENLKRREHDEAIQRAKQQKQAAPQRRTLTPAEFLSRKRSKEVEHPEFHKLERCV